MPRVYRPTPVESELLAQLRELALAHRVLADATKLAQLMRDEVIVRLLGGSKWAGPTVADAAFIDRSTPGHVRDAHARHRREWPAEIGDPAQLLANTGKRVKFLRDQVAQGAVDTVFTEEKRTG